MEHTADFLLVRDVLMRDWEPIICNELLPEDEYDIYIPTLIKFLESGSSNERIAEYLSFVEGIRMGVEIDHERTTKVANKLIAAWRQRRARP